MLEPELKALHDRAKAVRAEPGRPFCANYVWYRPCGFKDELCALVGYERKTGPDVLKSAAAYDLAYETLYDALPDCTHSLNVMCWG